MGKPRARWNVEPAGPSNQVAPAVLDLSSYTCFFLKWMNQLFCTEVHACVISKMDKPSAFAVHKQVLSCRYDPPVLSRPCSFRPSPTLLDQILPNQLATRPPVLVPGGPSRPNGAETPLSTTEASTGLSGRKQILLCLTRTLEHEDQKPQALSSPKGPTLLPGSHARPPTLRPNSGCCAARKRVWPKGKRPLCPNP